MRFSALEVVTERQILPFLDYEIIAANPKVFMGYSDITALLNAIQVNGFSHLPWSDGV